MNCPPQIMILRILDNDKNLRLWLPLFLVYLLATAFALVLAPLVIVAGIILYPFGWGKSLLLAGPYIYNVICNLRGLEVDVHKKHEQFFISFK
jgi:hypothetical protein